MTTDKHGNIDSDSIKHDAEVSRLLKALRSSLCPYPLENQVAQAFYKIDQRVKALEAYAKRYQLLSNYLISDDCQHDDAIVAARTVDQLNAVLAAMKQPKTLLLRLQPSRRSREQVAAPVALTDGDIDAVTIAQWGEMHGQPLAAHRAFARAIEAMLAAAPKGDAPCNVYGSYSLGGLK